MQKSERGFTLLELLVVIAIVSIMAAIICPVFASVRRDARRAVSTSNLKQCGMALLMYCDEYDGEKDMPSGDVAAQLVLKKMPTCDPNDTWRSGCSEDYGKPLIGSYAYVNNQGDDWQQLWLVLLEYNPNPPLLASIFYADPIPVAFHGFERNDYTGCGPNLSGCLVPNRLLEVRLDGSVKLVKIPANPHIVFNWGLFFLHDE